MLIILFALFAYLLGSIPFGYLVAKIKGIDIRRVGSGNIGGTNVWRTLGLGWGLLVGIFDALKSFLPVLLAGRYITSWGIVVIALMPLLGHVFPVWLNFRGGKGVATMFGTILFFFGWRGLLIWLAAWLVLLFLTRIMSLTNLIMVVALPLLFWLGYHDLPHVLYGLAIWVLIWWCHRENIQRLFAGRERQLEY